MGIDDVASPLSHQLKLTAKKVCLSFLTDPPWYFWCHGSLACLSHLVWYFWCPESRLACPTSLSHLVPDRWLACPTSFALRARCGMRTTTQRVEASARRPWKCMNHFRMSSGRKFHRRCACGCAIGV